VWLTGRGRPRCTDHLSQAGLQLGGHVGAAIDDDVLALDPERDGVASGPGASVIGVDTAVVVVGGPEFPAAGVGPRTDR
jgi:hypothetical protein